MEEQNLQPRPDRETVITIDLMKLIRSLLQHWWLLLIAAVLFGVGFFAGTHILIAPTYRSGFTAYVNNRIDSNSTESVSSSDITASENLTSTYAVIISSQPNVEAALEEAGMTCTFDEAIEWISIDAVDDTQVIQVSVTAEDPDTAYQLAQALEEVSPDYVAEIVEGSSMRIVASPNYPDEIYAPDYLRNALLGAVLGLFLAAAYIILRDLTDRRIKSAEALQERFDVPIVGIIHDLNSTGQGGYYGYGDAKDRGKGKRSQKKGGGAE